MSEKWLLRLAPFGPGALLGVCFIAAAWSSVGAASAPVQPGAATPASDAESSLRPFPTGGPRPALVVQSGHGAGFGYAAAFSPDGRRVLTGAGSVHSAAEAILWEVATGRQIRSFARPEPLQAGMEWFNSFAFSPDGRRIAAASCGRIAVVWDALTGQVIHTLDQGRRGRWRALFSPDGRHVVFASEWSAVVWDADTGKRLRTLDHEEGRVAAALEPKRGQQLVTAAGFAGVIVWDMATGEKVRTWDAGPGSIDDIQFSPDGSRILTTVTDSRITPDRTQYFGTVAVWDAGTGRNLSRIAVPGVLLSATFSGDGRQIMVNKSYESDIGADESEIIVYGAAGGAKVRTMPGTFWAVSSDSRLLLVKQADKEHPMFHDSSLVEISDAATGAVTRTLRSPGTDAVSATPNRDGTRLLAGYDHNWIEQYGVLWDLVEGRPARTVDLPESAHMKGNPGMMADLAPGGRRILLGRTADAGQHLEHVDAETGQVLAAIDVTTWKTVGPLDDQGRVLAEVDEELGMWDLASGRKSVGFAGHEKTWRLKGLALVDGAKQAFAGGIGYGPEDPSGYPVACYMEWCLWAVAGGALVSHFRKPIPEPLDVVAVSDDGSRVAAGVRGPGLGRDETGKADDRSGSVVIYDAATGDALRTLKIGTHWVDLLAFSPDGTRLLEAWMRQDFAVVYDAQSGDRLSQLSGHTSAIRSARFTSDGRRIVTSSLDGTVILWNAKTGAELARLVAFDHGREWLTITPQGYFDGSVDGRRRVCWRIENEVFPLELYEKRFYRPDLVSLAVRGLTTDKTAAVPGSHKPPQVRLETEKVESDSVTIRATATAGSKEARVASLRVLVDGRDLAPEQAQGIAIEKAAGPQAIFRGKVNFPPGKATAVVAAVASDEFGLRSDPAVVQIVRPGPTEAVKRNLYVLTVGVSNYQNSQFNLRFAAADAQALAKELGRQEGRAFEAVHARVLVDGDATIPNIREALVWLAKGCGPADVAVVLFSGHGARSSRGELFYVPYEADDENARATFLRWDEIDKGLRLIRASSVLFLSDCCHAGAFGERAASQDDLAYPLLTNARVMVFAASRGRESSLEKAELSHGAFTYAVLRGLMGEADLIKDGRVTISELQAYVANQVKVLTGDRQHPHIPRMNDFDPETVIAYVK